MSEGDEFTGGQEGFWVQAPLTAGDLAPVIEGDKVAAARAIAGTMATGLTTCPACDEDSPFKDARLEQWRFISHLNDDHLWTRERIADWLDATT